MKDEDELDIAAERKIIQEKRRQIYAEIQCRLSEPIDRKFIFTNDNNQWLIEISKDGIKFNRQVWPDFGPGEFAQAFVDILETNYEVKFTSRYELSRKLYDDHYEMEWGGAARCMTSDGRNVNMAEELNRNPPHHPK
jgi:hypothetical protein